MRIQCGLSQTSTGYFIPAPKPVQEMGKAPLSGASWKNYLPSPIAVRVRVHSSSLLPFLYQTPTLLSEPKTPRSFHAVSDYRRRRTFCSTSQGQAYADKVRRPNSDPIAFVDPYRKQTPGDLVHTEPQRQNKPSRPSTVTPSEQAVFNRLLKEVSQPTTLEPDDEDILDEDEPKGGYDPNVDLNSIFEDAIGQLRRQKEEVAKAAARSLLFAGVPKKRAIDTSDFDGEQALSGRVFRRPLKLANGTTLGNEAETEEERARLEVACDDHRTLVMGMLDKADSDAEIWRVLKKEVFSLITELDEHIRLVERAKTETALHAARVRKAKLEGRDLADVKLEKRDLSRREISSMNLSRTKAIPIDNLLSILHRNYAEYCLNALRLFRKHYPSSSYAPSVLSTIKQRGPISYVLGVSTEIYNEILFLKWTQHSDLHGVADTIQEMLDQGLRSNEVTIALIRGIAKQRRMGRREVLGPVVKAWWSMRGTVEGWRKVLNLYGRIMSEHVERAALLDDAESEDEDLETDKV